MEIYIGQVTHYFSRLSVAVLKLTAELKTGDKILILGRTTDYTQPVISLEIDHHKVQTVGPGDEVALKVYDVVRKGDKVYKVAHEEGGK